MGAATRLLRFQIAVATPDHTTRFGEHRSPRRREAHIGEAQWLGSTFAAAFVFVTRFWTVDEFLELDQGQVERERRVTKNTRFVQEQEEEWRLRFAESADLDDLEVILLSCLEDGWLVRDLKCQLGDELMDSRTFEPGGAWIDREPE